MAVGGAVAAAVAEADRAAAEEVWAAVASGTIARARQRASPRRAALGRVGLALATAAAEEVEAVAPRAVARAAVASAGLDCIKC